MNQRRSPHLISIPLLSWSRPAYHYKHYPSFVCYNNSTPEIWGAKLQFKIFSPIILQSAPILGYHNHQDKAYQPNQTLHHFPDTSFPSRFSHSFSRNTFLILFLSDFLCFIPSLSKPHHPIKAFLTAEAWDRLFPLNSHSFCLCRYTTVSKCYLIF